eukprot:7703443-Ditylum_brightwellii.AAC.1
MQWAVALGWIDIIAATVTMARFRPAPCQGHLKDYSNYKVEKKNWGHIYHPCQEEIPEDMLEPCGKPVMTTTFVDANLLHSIITGRSCTEIIHLLNKTPIDWFSTRQNTIETATYGSEFAAARTA